MTHSGGKPHKVGDRAQRYEVQAHGYPEDKMDNVICWTDTPESAERIMTAILKAPGCNSAAIFDRQDQRYVIRRYGGILR
jgi:hypothetical protein